MNAKEMAAREDRVQSVDSSRMGAIQRRLADKKPSRPIEKKPTQGQDIVNSRKSGF